MNYVNIITNMNIIIETEQFKKYSYVKNFQIASLKDCLKQTASYGFLTLRYFS